MRLKIKKCSCCNEIKYIFYSDWVSNISLNLCFNCANEIGFNPEITTELICAKCKDPFTPFKKESICWICLQKAKGKFKKAMKQEVYF